MVIVILLFSDLNPHVAVKKLTYDMTDKAMQCKEENDPIPIIKINSVCSMASPGSSPQTEVSPAHHLMARLCKTLHKFTTWIV